MVYFSEYLPRVGIVNITTDKKVQGLNQNSITFSDGEKYSLPHEILTNTISADVNNNIYNIRCKAIGGKRLSSNNGELYNRIKWDKQFFRQFSQEHFELQCSCGNAIIESENYSRIADLPNEYWHELMDLWHCHKPEITNSEIMDSNSNPLYTDMFNNELIPQDEEMLLGDSYIQLKINENLSCGKDDESAFCSRCCKKLGHYNATHGCVKLFKWTLNLISGNGKQQYDAYYPRDFVIQSLINAIDSLGTRVFEIQSSTGKSLFVWCFDLGIDIGLPNNKILKNTIKILYRSDKVESSKNQNIDFINVPNECFDDFHQSLKNIHNDFMDTLHKDWSTSYI